MRERGTPPDAICCQTVLRVLDRWDRAEEAAVLFEDMKRQGLACLPGASFWPLWLDLAWPQVLSLSNLLYFDIVSPSNVHYCLFSSELAEEMYCCGIRALEKLGRWSAAVELLEEWRGLDGYNKSGKDNSVVRVLELSVSPFAANLLTPALTSFSACVSART